MYAIILLLTVAFLLFIRRIRMIRKSIMKMEEEFKITLNFPAAFYAEQVFTLFVAIIFLLALDPVPAYLAFALLLGVIVNLIISSIQYSLPKYGAKRSCDWKMESGD